MFLMRIRLTECGYNEFYENEGSIGCDLEKIEKIITENKNINKIKDNNNATLLHYACCKSAITNLKLVKLLLKHNCEVNVRYNEQLLLMAPIHLATIGGHIEIVDLLVDHDADLNIKNKYEMTPLHLASKFNQYLITYYLLIKNVKNDIDYSGNKAIHLAVERGYLDIIKKLIEIYPTDINAVNTITGDTPIHLAAEFGHFEVVKFLFENGVNVNKLNNKKQSALQLAKLKILTYKMKEYDSIIKLLEPYDKITNIAYFTDICLICRDSIEEEIILSVFNSSNYFTFQQCTSKSGYQYYSTILHYNYIISLITCNNNMSVR